MKAVFDIGGTTTRVAVYEDKNSLLKSFVYSTPRNFNEAVKKLVLEIRNLAGEKKLTAVAGGLAGVISPEGKILKSVNLPDFENKNLVKLLQKELCEKVYLENDCTMVGLGEIEKGTAGNGKVIAYVTISTGVGAKRFIQGRPSESELSFEPGKQIILANKGTEKTWEQLVSGSAIFKNIGKIPSLIEDSKFWEEEARLIAIGLYNITLHWRPEVIVLGGGVIVKTKIKLSTIEKYLKKLNTVYPWTPKLKKAKLGDFGGLYGAMVFLDKIKKGA